MSFVKVFFFLLFFSGHYKEFCLLWSRVEQA